MDESPGPFAARAILAVSLAAGLGHLALVAPRLPERVASHFDLAGRPDGWMSQGAFALVYAALELFVGLVFVGVVELTLRAPKQWINVPHREHWLAPEREAATRATIARDLAWIGASTFALLALTVHHSWRVSVGAAGRTPAIPWILVAFVLAPLAWTLRLCLRWMRVPRGRGPAGG